MKINIYPKKAVDIPGFGHRFGLVSLTKIPVNILAAVQCCGLAKLFPTTLTYLPAYEYNTTS